MTYKVFPMLKARMPKFLALELEVHGSYNGNVIFVSWIVTYSVPNLPPVGNTNCNKTAELCLEGI